MQAVVTAVGCRLGLCRKVILLAILWFQDMESSSWGRAGSSLRAGWHSQDWQVLCKHLGDYGCPRSCLVRDPAANAIGMPCRCMAAMGENSHFTVEFKVHCTGGDPHLTLKARIKHSGWVNRNI